MKLKSIRYISTVALIFALLVVMLGAYTRLTHAGLGCPDWPGCYGNLVLPSVQSELSHAQKQYPDVPIETRKAWTEMLHRYAAGTLALLILLLVLSVFSSSLQKKPLPKLLPLGLIFLVGLQAVLGMWTVTLKLLPVVVMSHLLGGILIFSGLCYFRWQLSKIESQNLPTWRWGIAGGIVIVLVQIGLGGWVSSNYAGIACIGFPQCNAQWFLPLHFSQGFNLFSPVGANYQGGLLDNEVRVTIQIIHRLGALVTAGYVLTLSGLLLTRTKKKYIHTLAWCAVILVLTQFALGVLNVIYLLPLWIAVAHNGVAALLLATMFSLFYLAQGEAVNVYRY